MKCLGSIFYFSNLEILHDEGIRDDSSIFPVNHPEYGIPGAETAIHRIELPNGGTLREFPMTVGKVLGNTRRGDGYRFRGRGPLQLTGRDNYRRAGRDLKLDLVSKPEQVATPEVGFRVAAWFWNQKRLNRYADRGDFKRLTRRLNGGLNGYAVRAAYYLRAKRVLRD